MTADTDGSGSIEITDPIIVFDYLFVTGVAPGCLASANSNRQLGVNISSGIYILNFLFLGGPEPPAPFPDCGRSSFEGDVALGCKTPHDCP